VWRCRADQRVDVLFRWPAHGRKPNGGRSGLYGAAM
jgi:hypothetical protein